MAQILLPGNATLRVATPADHTFIRSLARKFSNEIGFIPDTARDWYVDAGRVTLALENGDPAGYLLGRDSLRWNRSIRPITQAAIHFDAQRRHNGLTLVAATEAAAREAGQVVTQANCREGIDANDFWRIAGYECIARLDPANARGKMINVWRKQLTDFRPIWFESPPPVAGYLARRTTIAR
jgi:N-acetylglutamate synthase-like GNAT family acetyltransferase